MSLCGNSNPFTSALWQKWTLRTWPKFELYSTIPHFAPIVVTLSEHYIMKISVENSGNNCARLYIYWSTLVCVLWSVCKEYWVIWKFFFSRVGKIPFLRKITNRDLFPWKSRQLFKLIFLPILYEIDLMIYVEAPK